jgi:hypothetical protein
MHPALSLKTRCDSEPSNFRTERLQLEVGGLPKVLQCHSWETILRHVHGYPQLHLPQAEDA